MSNGRPPRTVDLNDVITEIMQLLRRVVGDKLIQRIRLDPRLSRIDADPALLNGAFVSLATNAFGAMQAGTELAVATANITLDLDQAMELGVLPGAYVKVEFTLTSAGLSVPATVRDSIRHARGAVSIRNVGAGVVMIVVFPISAATDRIGYGPMILIVQRRPEVRETMRKTLEAAGYEVLEAADAAEAAAVLASCQVDLMITNSALEPSFQRSHPNLKIIAAPPISDAYGLLDAVRREVKAKRPR